MLILNVSLLLISLCQGFSRSASLHNHRGAGAFNHGVDDYENDDYGTREDALLQVIDAIQEEEENRYRKRQVPRVKRYRIYNDDGDEDEDDGYDEYDQEDFKYALKSAFENAKHDYIHQHHKKKKKELVHHTKHHVKKALHYLHHNDNENKKMIVARKKDSLLNKRKIENDVPEYVKQPVKKDVDNDQIASIKVDDSVEKRQKLINDIDAKEVFYEPNVNVSKNATKSPSHAHVKGSKVTSNKLNKDGLDHVSFIAVIAGCCVAGLAGIILAGYCWFKLRQETKEKNVLPETGKINSPNGKKGKTNDDKMVQSAEVFHYQHAKKQMQQMEPTDVAEKYHMEGSSDEEEEDEDTVYECPGLAAPGDMKIVNPLFSDAESHHSDKQSDNQSQGDTPTEDEPKLHPK
ncbi:uncharacterized protein LOC130613132 [Hydractinia symbiolongicarpus]|uniref:uncharacterized protein LOC130613132 n=1 Tax=Hydractinia symbiolongicarpus TaxID=13093 RepID=UPI00254EF375|nr:uncharacterized protein LOC130613132 [Hydractinia symbiolongicarpus]